MNNGTAGFEENFRAPSPVSTPALNWLAMPLLGAPTHASPAQHTQLFSSSSCETSGSSIFSRPSIDSLGYRTTSWSSGEADQARRSSGIEERCYALQRENLDLNKQLAVWKAKFETIQTAYSLLLERVPEASNIQHRKLNPEDYKLIDYWYKHQWMSSSGDRITEISGKAGNENDDDGVEVNTEEAEGLWSVPCTQRGQSRSRAGINVSMRYIQDKDGQVIDGHRAREIRIHARAIFVGFASQGKQFSSWGDADAVSRRTFYNEMASRFEELQYCDLDWKAEQIAIDTYPGWKVTWLKKKKKTLDEKSGLKRPHQEFGVEESDPKRLKAAESTSTPSFPPSETPVVTNAE
ncbi:hypothetical protein BDN70DRAFT_901973 [Pholiota conissans]|uniref:Uncharacterized protein n=1 Tax=Pholiota conissans TaxID=109636 RepID=A0A9P6CSH8_9AGAR|nr:hypothetical protein BDN70DRAFT_901973 [Pholiota conissans]